MLFSRIIFCFVVLHERLAIGVVWWRGALAAFILTHELCVAVRALLIDVYKRYSPPYRDEVWCDAFFRRAYAPR